MIICRTPFRISFFGGGTDIPVWYRENGGTVAVPYNVATGKATTIKELAKLITEIYQYEPKFNFDVTKPSMIPKRLVDVSKISDDLGWRARIDLRAGLQKTVSWLEEQG